MQGYSVPVDPNLVRSIELNECPYPNACLLVGGPLIGVGGKGGANDNVEVLRVESYERRERCT